MIQLQRHIEILLLDVDCVIVPGLGGFMAHHVEARYDEAESLFLPPQRTLGFNPQLTMNDSLLVQSYIEAYDISYPEALRRIEQEVHEVRQHLDNEGYYELNDIGELTINDEGRLEFSPCEAGILTPSLYGLSTFEMEPLATARPAETATLVSMNDEQSEQLTGADEAEKPEPAIVIKLSSLRNAAALAAAIIALVLLVTPMGNSGVGSSLQQSAVFPASSVRVDRPQPVTIPQEQPVADSLILPTPSPEDSTTTDLSATEGDLDHDKQPTTPVVATPDASTLPYTIVMASQTTLRHASSFVEELRGDGFPEARVSEGKMVRVVYGHYASEAEAQDTLRQLRKKSRDFAEAWVLKEKV